MKTIMKYGPSPRHERGGRLELASKRIAISAPATSSARGGGGLLWARASRRGIEDPPARSGSDRRGSSTIVSEVAAGDHQSKLDHHLAGGRSRRSSRSSAAAGYRPRSWALPLDLGGSALSRRSRAAPQPWRRRRDVGVRRQIGTGCRLGSLAAESAGRRTELLPASTITRRQR